MKKISSREGSVQKLFELVKATNESFEADSPTFVNNYDDDQQMISTGRKKTKLKEKSTTKKLKRPDTVNTVKLQEESKFLGGSKKSSPEPISLQSSPKIKVKMIEYSAEIDKTSENFIDIDALRGFELPRNKREKAVK